MVFAGVADSASVSAGAVDSAAMETLVAPPVLGVQKPPRWVGRRFRDRFAAAPLVNLFLDIPSWGAQNDHFRSWAAIYLKPLVSTLLDVKHRASPNDLLPP